MIKYLSKQRHKNAKPNFSAGFIALMSAIIISVILLLITSTASFSGFYSRFNILDSEFKEHSLALADLCVDQVLLRLATDSTYAGGESVLVNASLCTIIASPNPIANPRTFLLQAIYKDAYTNLRISVDVDTLGITSWEEIAKIEN